MPKMSLMNRNRSNALYWLNVPVLLVAIYGGWQLVKSRQRKVLTADEFQEFELVEKKIISYNTAIYRFKLPRPNDVLGLPTGQHVSLSADVEGQSKPVVRSYTPISDDSTPGYVDLIIKSYPTGTLSKHIASLGVGQTLKFRGPKGAMEYTPNMARRIGMIAGGTGITPMLQVAKAIVRGRSEGDKTEVDLIFANVKYSDILLKDELDKLAELDSGFRIYYVLNDPPENWKGGVGFVTTDMIKEKLPAPAADVKVFICGPPPMVSAMKKSTESLGFDKARGFSKRDDQVFCF